MAPTNSPDDLTANAAECRDFFNRWKTALGQTLVLPAPLVEQAAIGLLTGGHLLLEGNPGLGKRTLASTMARLSGLSFSVIPCTADLEPVDLAGTEELREDAATGKRGYEFLLGPLFANVVCAEDVHLAVPKTLSMLVDAMRRRQVGHGRDVRDLPEPFVLVASMPATLEEGECQLNPSVLDRFLLKLSMGYPSESDEWEIARRSEAASVMDQEPLISPERLAGLRNAAMRVEMPDDVLGYAWALVRATRPGNDLAPDFVETWIRLGVSPLGLVALVSAAKARALLHGRSEATRRDVYNLTGPVLQHRLLANDEAAAAGLTIDRLIGMLLERISLDGEYRPQSPDASRDMGAE